MLLVMGFAVWELANGRVTLGELLVFVTPTSASSARPGRRVRRPVERESSAKAGAERIIEILDQQPAVVRSRRPSAAHPRAGRARTAGRRFTYPDTERPALSGVDLRIAPGERSPWSGEAGQRRR